MAAHQIVESMTAPAGRAGGAVAAQRCRVVPAAPPELLP